MSFRHTPGEEPAAPTRKRCNASSAFARGIMGMGFILFHPGDNHRDALHALNLLLLVLGCSIAVTRAYPQWGHFLVGS